MSKLSDEWETLDWLFKELDEEFGFDIDLCATKENSKCTWFCIDYLKNRLVRKLGQFNDNLHYYIENTACFMNPPYSNPKPFIEKAWKDSKYCKIVCLVKCDPSTKWWATFWQYSGNCPLCKNDKIRGYVCPMCQDNHTYNGPKPGCEVRFFPKRIKFDAPEGLKGKNGPTFPCALVIMDRRGHDSN